nr:hypothetical protein FIAIKCIJ_00004 [uncultured bacterium]
MTQEGAVGNGFLGGQRRQSTPALDDRPQDQPLGLLAVGPLGRRRLVQRQPGVHGLAVVAGVERTAGPRRSEGTPGAIDVYGDDQSLPGDQFLRLVHCDQRASAFGQRRMLGKERLDVTGTCRTEPRDACPPPLAPGHAQGQVGQRADARRVQHANEPQR